jgi:glycosyltransferase involved in cell wall biosynthesis
LSQFFAVGRLTEEDIRGKRKELGIKPGDAVIGMVGSLEPRKGHIHLIEAAKEIVGDHPNARFLVVGEGFYRGELERAVQNQGLRDHVLFRGYRTDIAEVMATFDILALTSLWEGLPQVLVQAAAVGLPIATFEVEGAREVVKDGVNGFVVPLKDVDQLVEKIDYLLADLDRAREMGLRGRELVDDAWRVETMVRQTDALYQRLLRERGIVPLLKSF